MLRSTASGFGQLAFTIVNTSGFNSTVTATSQIKISIVVPNFVDNDILKEFFWRHEDLCQHYALLDVLQILDVKRSPVQTQAAEGFKQLVVTARPYEGAAYGFFNAEGTARDAIRPVIRHIETCGPEYAPELVKYPEPLPKVEGEFVPNFDLIDPNSDI